MKDAMSAEAAALGARTRTLSGSIQRAGMGLCFGWGRDKRKGRPCKMGRPFISILFSI
jgi:hypothetical protein